MQNNKGASTQPSLVPDAIPTILDRPLLSMIDSAFHNADKVGRTADLVQDMPQAFPADGVKCFYEIYKEHIEVRVLFPALLHLSHGEYHVSCASTSAQLTLALGENIRCKYMVEQTI